MVDITEIPLDIDAKQTYLHVRINETCQLLRSLLTDINALKTEQDKLITDVAALKAAQDLVIDAADQTAQNAVVKMTVTATATAIGTTKET